MLNGKWTLFILDSDAKGTLKNSEYPDEMT